MTTTQTVYACRDCDQCSDDPTWYCEDHPGSIVDTMRVDERAPVALPEGLEWITPPECQGQIVEVSYASDCEAYLWRRVHDRADQSTRYARVDLDDLDDADLQPWNREPSVSDWESVRVEAE